MWIKLHSSSSDSEVYVNPENIISIIPTNQGTIVTLVGGDDDYITAKEPPRDIFILMQDDMAEFENGRLKLTHNKG